MQRTAAQATELRRPLVTRFAEPAPTTRKPLRRERPLVASGLQLSTDPLHLRLGEELEFVQRQVEALAKTIAHDPIRVMRQTVTLQTFNTVAQVLADLAAVSRAGNSAEAVSRIVLPELKARLERRSL